ncbi:MAG: hypothetical protein C4339_01970 [Nitrososphaerota archaeon]
MAGLSEEGLRIELGGLASMARELASYLRTRTGLEVAEEGGALLVKASAPGLKALLRTCLKGFLHDKGLREQYRVTARGPSLRLAERKGAP